MAGVPPVLCIQCGTNQNPCGCKVVGPTLGFLVGAVSAIVAYPAGAVTWCVSKNGGRRLFATPARIMYATNMAIPI